MKPKTITVVIDPETGGFTCDLTGFEGKGCADVIKLFRELGTATDYRKKPEFNAIVKTQQPLQQR
jgi:hypothetical protein